MKIAVNTCINELLNEFIKGSRKESHEIIPTKTENVLFEHIERDDVDAYVISDNNQYFKKAIDFIRKANPYTPIVVLTSEKDNGIAVPTSADIVMSIGSQPYTQLVGNVFFNIERYVKTFATLKKLTAKIHEKIEFATCMYDPTRRLLYHKGKEVKKLGAKEGGILEILAANYKEVVKKEVILEKVWRKTDYFAGRSMDVYTTHLRNTFRDNKIKLTITNISGIGFILE